MKKLNKNFKNLFYIFSILLFFSSSLFTNFGYLKEREYPFAFDNYFGFLIKSKNFDLCFQVKSCKGLESIEKQIESITESYNHKAERLKAQVFKIYHPFYSISLSTVNFFIKDILQSLNVLNFFLLIIITISITKFSKELFNKEVTSLLLIILSFNNYHGWGYASHINPFILSQAFSMLVFYSLFKNSKFLIIINNVLASLTHPVGIFTNLVTIFYLIFKDNKKKEVVLKHLLTIIICFLLILVIYFNNFSFLNNLNIQNSSILNQDYNFLSLMYGNISKFFFVYDPMIKTYGLPLLLVCSIFFICSENNRYKTLLIFLIYFMTILTVVFDKPFITLPQRFMNITGIVLLGSFIYTWIFLIDRFIKNLNFKIFITKKNKYKAIIQFLTKDFSILIAPLFLIFYFQNIIGGIINYKDYFSYFDKNYNVQFSKNQTILIKKNSHLIFDNSERADYFYMLNGLQKDNFFYYKFFPIEDEILTKTNLYYISLSPLYSNKNNSDLFFNKNSIFKIVNKESKEIFLKFKVIKDTVIKYNNKKIKYTKSNTEIIKLNSYESEFHILKGKIKIIALGDLKKFNLPWDQNISLIINEKKDLKKITFKSPVFLNCRLEIINDEGTSILSKINGCS